MRTIRASELGSFLYCQRAWWYRDQGIPAENQGDLEAGSDYHRLHGRRVVASALLRLGGWALLLLALAALVVILVSQWLG